MMDANLHLWNFDSLSSTRDVFLLFAIPVGGGIPAGVLMAQSKGIGWAAMTLIYFVSDVVLAFLFEPILKGIGWLGRHIDFLGKLIEHMKFSTQKTIARFGPDPGPILLISIAFGVDPMTGRAAALAAGHNFITGWAIAIAGDMLFFGLIAMSTLLLNDILGDGTWAAIIIMCLMMFLPPMIRKMRSQWSSLRK